MSDEHAVPEFTLPDWGSDGAPPEPPVTEEIERPPSDGPGDVAIVLERAPLVTTIPLPSAWPIETIHGLVTAHGHSDDADLTSAAADATAAAVEALQDAASDLGANAVVGVGLSSILRKGVVVVTAVGTAVRVSR